MAEKALARHTAKQPTIQVRALGQGATAKILQMFGKNPPPHTIDQTLAAYSTMPWLRSINDKIGGSLSSLRWRAFVKVEPGEKGFRRVLRDPALQNLGFDQRVKAVQQLQDNGELVEIPDHPILTAIYNEGDNFSGVTLRELTQKYLDLVGEAFWIKVRNAEGMPVEFLPVPPHWVKDTPSTDEPYFILEPPESHASRYDTKIPPEDMIWFYHPDPYNPYKRGVGMGTTLADELETGEYASKFMKSFFFNNARPDFLIHSDDLTKEDTIRLEQRWMDKLRGTFKNFLPFFANKKLDITRLTADYGHLRMLELSDHQRDTCLQVYGAQPEIFGITEASNRATSEVAEYLFSRWVIVPRAEFMRAVLQLRLVPDYDQAIILHYDSPIMEDKEHKLKVATIAPWCLSLDEWREMMEMMPLPDGKGKEVFCKPLNYEFYDIDKAEEPPEEDPPPDNSGDNPDDEDDVTPVDGEDETDTDDDMSDDEKSQSVADAFQAYLEEVRGNAWAAVPELEELIDGRDLDGIIAILDKLMSEHEDLDREIQKLVMVRGMQTLERIQPYLPADAKVETYDREAHNYTKDGTPILDEFIVRALEVIDTAVPMMLDKRMTPRDIAEKISGLLGLTEDEWLDTLASNTIGDEHNEKLESRLRSRLVADAESFAQLQVVRNVMRDGLLSKKHIKRTWIATAADYTAFESCKAMHGQHVAGADYWNLESGDTVIVPTRSHPDCHCREHLTIHGGEK